MAWNQQLTNKMSVGGGLPVWAVQPERRIAGGMVGNALKVGGKVSAGSPVDFNYVTKVAKFLKCFKINTATVNALNTDLVIFKSFVTPQLYTGMVIMVMPATMTGTGKAVVVGAVTETAITYATTVVTADMDALAAGGFLVESSSAVAGAAKSIYCQPNNLSIEDTVVGDQNELGIPRGMKYVFENCIPAMPAVVKANITFVEWENFNEKV